MAELPGDRNRCTLPYDVLARMLVWPRASAGGSRCHTGYGSLPRKYDKYIVLTCYVAIFCPFLCLFRTVQVTMIVGISLEGMMVVPTDRSWLWVDLTISATVSWPRSKIKGRCFEVDVAYRTESNKPMGKYARKAM